MSDGAPRILIVEDEGIVAADIKVSLEAAGFEVTGVAASADDAIEEASANPPDLALMDIRIQGSLDGIELADLLYQRFGLPSVYLTAHGDQDTIERAKRTHPLGFLLKPFKQPELINAVGFAIEKAAAERREREARQAALRQSEERFRNLVGILPAGVFTCDAAGAITFYNERAAQLWGRRPRTGSGGERFCGCVRLRRPDGRPLPHSQSPVALAIAEGRAFRDEQVIIERPDGSLIHALINIVPVVGPAGAINGAITAFTDITALKQTEEKLVAANRRLEFLSGSAAGLLAADDPAAFLEQEWRRLRELLDVDYVFHFVDEGNGEPRLAAQYGVPEEAAARLEGLALSQAICGSAADAAPPRVIGREERSGELAALDMAACACFPLNARERHIGALAFGSRLRRSFSEEELAFLGSVAHEVAIALDRKAAVDALRQSEERLALALKAGRSGSFDWNVKTGVALWSDDLLALYGMRRDEFGGRYQDWLDCLVPEDREAAEAAVKQAAETGEFLLDFRIRRRDNGEIRWMHGRGDMLFDAAGRPARMIGINVDISGRKRAEEALRESEQRYRLLVDANPMGVIFAEIFGDRSGRILAANDAFLRLVDRSREELESGALRSEDLTPPEYLAVDAQAIAEARELGQSTPYEKEFLRKDGSRVPAMVARAVVGERRDKMVAFVADLTERKRTEQALREAQKLESIGLLAGGIAHDFNNLLTGILGNASLLEMDSNANSGQLRAIIESAEKAASLTRQLLAYAGKGQFQITDFDISRLIRSSADLLRLSIPKNIEVRVRAPRNLPPVRGDCSQIQQVLMNLVMNAAEAIEHRSGGRVLIDASVREFDRDAAAGIGSGIAPGSYVSITVQDNGCGMDEQTRAQIFDPFFTTKFTGRGLGLAAVQGILRSHQGTVTVESKPGEGSTFTVYLPASGAQAADEAGGIEPGSQCRQASTVLVVDDEAGIRDLTRAALERLGHTVLEAENGQKAFEVLESNPGVRLVLLDVIMPVVGGAEAFWAIREKWPDLPILVTSGYSRQETNRLGIPDNQPFLEKPYTAQRLAAAVERALAAELTAD